MSKHVINLVCCATVAISKQSHMSPEGRGYEQATNDAADIFTNLIKYVERLEACVNQINVATIEAEVIKQYPFKTIQQLLED